MMHIKWIERRHLRRSPRQTAASASKPTTLRTRTALAALATVAIGAATLLTAQPAAAAATYCHASGSCPVFAGSDPSLYYADIPNYTGVSMICWTDAAWYSVNYWSNRWFKVNTIYTGPTWMHSSEVYNQTTVGHC